jgi:branched-chain amino acid transport system ATP-binding protein
VLSIENLHVAYGPVHALEGISLEVPRGQIISIIGSNGAGKTTLLNTICALIIVQVPEGRKVFAGLTVRENLMAGGYVLKEALRLQQNIEKMFDLYPILRDRQNQQAGTLSGGEQQMLAICRGLMAEPKLLLLDEPSLGLGPIIVNGVFQLIRRIREQGITVVLVEQNARKALALCNYAYVLENGKIAMRGQGRELLCDAAIKKAYLGECS